MQLSDRENELINKFLDREASESDLTEIESLKNTSEPFRVELLKQKAIISSLKAREKARKFEAVRAMVAAHAIEIDEDLDDSDYVVEDDTPIISLNNQQDSDPVASNAEISARPPYLRYAAAIAVLLTIGFLLYTVVGGGMSADELYVAYYQPLDPSVSTRSETQDKVENPLDPYLAGDYQSAITTLEDAIADTTNSAMLSVYLGISLLEVGRVEDAEAVLSEIYQKYANDFSGQHAEWYLALMALKDDPEKARQAFQQIVDQQGMYEGQAKKVLEEM